MIRVIGIIINIRIIRKDILIINRLIHNMQLIHMIQFIRLYIVRVLILVDLSPPCAFQTQLSCLLFFDSMGSSICIHCLFDGNHVGPIRLRQTILARHCQPSYPTFCCRRCRARKQYTRYSRRWSTEHRMGAEEHARWPAHGVVKPVTGAGCEVAFPL